MSNIIYDEGFTMTLSNNNYGFAGFKGAFTGNGKIAMYNSLSDLGAENTFISVGDITHEQIGKYKNNVIEGFGMTDVRILDPTDSNISYQLESQTLRMLTGQVSSVFNVSSNNVIVAKIKNDVTPLRQYPYCVLQSVTVTPSANMDSLDIYHFIKSHSNITSIEYNNNTFFNDKIYDSNGVYIMNARGTQVDAKCDVVCASCYFDNANVLGFNVTYKKASCYQQIRYSSPMASTPITFHVLSVSMTSKDFPDPLEEAKRILMNVAFKQPNTNSLITQLYQDNSDAWGKLWSCDIELRPKTTVTGAERTRVVRLKRYIRSSLFNIFACVREGVNAEVNPLSLSYVDTNGNLFYDSDVWLVPTLLLLRPNIARTLLEFRYKGLEQAIQLAASYGYNGSKYPYENDIVGYKNVYWDVASPLHIFNNAVIAINAWNYYRISLDKDWLQAKGYIVMKNVADFIVGNLDSNYDMHNVVGLGGRTSDNHGFTLYSSRLALKYTIEASYELNYAPKTAWLNAYQNMDIEFYAAPNYDVVKYDTSYTNTTQLKIADTLMILLPYYSYLYFNNKCNTCTRDHTSVLRNLLYYANSIDQQNPINNILIAALYGLISQSNTSYLSEFYSRIDTIISSIGEKDYWGNLSATPENGVDITLNAFFVFLFLTVAGGMRINGGITEGKFYYEQYGINGPYSINLPSTWNNIVFSAVGINEELYNVVNNVMSS